MKFDFRIREFWQILIGYALRKEKLTYEQLCEGTPFLPQFVARYLYPIQAFCVIEDFPLLTILAVNSQTGKPGFGIFDDEKEYHRVIEFDWSVIPIPTEEQFKMAREKLPTSELKRRNEAKRAMRQSFDSV